MGNEVAQPRNSSTKSQSAKSKSTDIQLLNKNAEKNKSNNSEMNINSKNNYTLDDFEFVKDLGRGAFGKVSLYKSKSQKSKINFVAIKEIDIQALSQKERKKY